MDGRTARLRISRPGKAAAQQGDVVFRKDADQLLREVIAGGHVLAGILLGVVAASMTKGTT